MRLIHTVRELRAALEGESRTAFVPTMGNLHEGHIALVRQAACVGKPVVASIFVNPLQFGQGEDFERYPRTLAEDSNKLAAAGCELLFVPDVGEMYPEPQTFQVHPPMANELCGAFRPGHFAGVCTVVLKLFELVRPRYAVFGKKDYQQLHLIKAMVRQFNLAIDILEGETVRATDGLALSSRNGYLSDRERIEAPRLNAELRKISESIRAGNRDYSRLEQDAEDRLSAAGWKIDYIRIRASATLQSPSMDDFRLVILGAAWLNNTRLIDNIEVVGD